ncbi:MAG: DUF2490 domain-containing protein [Flavobacteriales bacterium]|nr:DUF2490 domain-containing protein [Flavobacteriales bacterium]
MKRFAAFGILFILWVGVVSAQNNDAQLWTWVSIQKKINKRMEVSLEQQLRLDNNISAIGNVFTEASLSYRFNKYVRYTVNYRYINRGQREGGFISGNRYTGDLRLRYKMKPFIITYRNRMQREFRNELKGVREITFNRNKLEVALDLDKKFSPFFAFEIYYHFNKSEFNKNRYTLGVDFDLKNRNEFSLYYRLQQTYNVKNPGLDYIVGFGLAHRLKGRLLKKKKKAKEKEPKTE